MEENKEKEKENDKEINVPIDFSHAIQYLKKFEFLPQAKLSVVIYDLNENIQYISQKLLDNPLEFDKTKKFVNLLEQFQKLLDEFKKEEL